MVLLIHIAVASFSIFYSLLVAFSPTKNGVRNIYFLMLGTASSGLILAYMPGINLGKFCLSGVFYLMFTAVMLNISKRRLVSANTSIR